MVRNKTTTTNGLYFNYFLELVQSTAWFVVPSDQKLIRFSWIHFPSIDAEVVCFAWRFIHFRKFSRGFRTNELFMHSRSQITKAG